MNSILIIASLFLLEILYIKLAQYYKIFDSPNDRNLHIEDTIRGGGIIFWIGMLLYFLSSNFTHLYFFIGLTLASVVSFWDDIAGLSISYRLLTHFVATSLLLFEMDYFSNPAWLIILAIVLVIGIMNASNFMDGINGMMVGNSIVVIGSLWYVNDYHLKFIDENLIIYTLLGLMVFLFFNFRTKAVCFAGDVGSISIGFIISFLLLKLIIKENNLLYILFLVVYGVDSVLTIIQRMCLKENIFEPHCKHLFQILVQKFKLKHLFVSLIYLIIQLIVCTIIILNLNKSIENQQKIGVLTVFILSTLYVIIKMKLLKMRV